MKSSRTCRGQVLKAKAEAKDKSSRTRTRTRTKFWPRGQLVLEDLTSLLSIVKSLLVRLNVFTREKRRDKGRQNKVTENAEDFLLVSV